MYGTQWYIRIGNLGFNLVLLNLLWLLFSFFGLFILGIFPATAALFAVMRLIIMESDNGSIIKLFWDKFKSEFIASNVVGYIMLFIGLVLYTDFKVLHYINQETLYIMLMSVTMLVIFIYLLSLLYIFSVFVHYDLKLWQYPKHAFILVIARPLHTLIMAASIVTILFLYLQLPVLILLFGISLISFVLMKIAHLSFLKKEV
ncbi:YesL family protein [Planococcus soli]|uniref:YesL family protein n=1 Tax=Planococcus soli TaxID=2666072 RepID=UPI00163D4B55